MRIALQEARQAYERDEIPVGAVLIDQNQKVIAQAANNTDHNRNPLAHAEKLVIESALATGKKFLYNYTLYVTLEPCVMCCGIIMLSRVSNLVFGCHDPKAGAAGSLYFVPQDRRFNHNTKVVNGILENECSEILKQFFSAKRK